MRYLPALNGICFLISCYSNNPLEDSLTIINIISGYITLLFDKLNIFFSVTCMLSFHSPESLAIYHVFGSGDGWGQDDPRSGAVVGIWRGRGHPLTPLE